MRLQKRKRTIQIKMWPDYKSLKCFENFQLIKLQILFKLKEYFKLCGADTAHG